MFDFAALSAIPPMAEKLVAASEQQHRDMVALGAKLDRIALLLARLADQKEGMG